MNSGTLRNDDSDGNENSKKAVGLEKQNNNFSCASHFSAVIAQLQLESALFHLSRMATQRQQLSFAFPEL